MYSKYLNISENDVYANFYLSSPCANPNGTDYNWAAFQGGVNWEEQFYTSNSSRYVEGNKGIVGFRPVVCLKSGVSLISHTDENNIVTYTLDI